MNRRTRARNHFSQGSPKITWQISRSDLGRIRSIRLSKATGIASYFDDFANEYRRKIRLKLRCQNVKLFLREPLAYPVSASHAHFWPSFCFPLTFSAGVIGSPSRPKSSPVIYLKWRPPGELALWGFFLGSGLV